MTIGRLRRSQPRNPDTMEVCDELEKRIIEASRVEGSSVAERRSPKPDAAGSNPAPSASFDKRAYQREYMKKKRAEKKS